VDYVSIFNDVLGPVMRGPSSSHTAGAYRIAAVARSLLGEAPVSAVFAFDPDGSYAPTYSVCGVDLAVASGLLGIPMVDERFFDALSLAANAGIDLRFEVRRLPGADHPNYTEIALVGVGGRTLSAAAKSIGGGVILFSEVDGTPVGIDAKCHELLVVCDRACVAEVRELLGRVPGIGQACEAVSAGGDALVRAQTPDPPPEGVMRSVESLPGVRRTYAVEPVFLPQRGPELWSAASEMVARAEEDGVSLGRVALERECRLLGMTEPEALDEMARRLGVMRQSVEQGLSGEGVRLRLVEPCAGAMLERERRGELPVGGLHARAAARALAVMHVNNSMGVVCAAPTGGSAGTLPGTVVTMLEDAGLSEEECVLALFAAGAVGVVIARRVGFAAETAGCQVEIGAAGAMAAAAVVEAFGGTAGQAVDAAAIALHNSMGLVCDPVQGGCEIPCHTRNAAAAASAFVFADLVMGGYANPIPLDETVDAVRCVGEMMRPQLRCTARGGIAVCPSALALGG